MILFIIIFYFQAAGIRIGTLLNSLSTFIIANTIALYLEWKLALVVISFSPIILLSAFFEQKFTQGDYQVNQNYLENSANVSNSSLLIFTLYRVIYNRYKNFDIVFGKSF
jgi:ABC-type bacteriocin/lantibiotic exporter with double-glycine peptidase domain